MAVSVGAVAFVFTYANVSNWHNGMPLGYDSFYYVGWINQVVANGPLQFAASKHYVEFLYPIVASIPVYLGATANSVEIALPVALACGTVVATGILALELKDLRASILTVAFASGWFAIYAFGADFHANLFAFPLLLLATTLLVRAARNGNVRAPFLGAFLLLVVLAAAAHVETTDFLIASWIITFLIGRPFMSSTSQSSSMMIIVAAVAASPFTFAYLQGVAGGGLGGQYCVVPAEWIRILGPTAGLSILGFGVAARRYNSCTHEDYLVNVLFFWSVLSLGIGALGYVTNFPITVSDRALLLLPLPFLSSIGTLWLVNRLPRGRWLSQAKLLAIAALVIPLVTTSLVFSYVAPDFRYFAEHGPSLVTCGSN